MKKRLLPLAAAVIALFAMMIEPALATEAEAAAEAGLSGDIGKIGVGLVFGLGTLGPGIGLGLLIKGAIESMARREGATPFIVLLAAFGAWLGRYTGQEDLCIGSVVANRPTPAHERLIGLFVNTIVLRVGLEGDPTFRASIQRAKHVALEALAHQQVPFERIVDGMRANVGPGEEPVNVMLVVQNAPPTTPSLRGIECEPLTTPSATAKFDLSLVFASGSRGATATFACRTQLFEPSTLERMARHFLHLLEAALRDPDRAVGDLPMMDEREQRVLLGPGIDA